MLGSHVTSCIVQLKSFACAGGLFPEGEVGGVTEGVVCLCSLEPATSEYTVLDVGIVVTSNRYQYIIALRRPVTATICGQRYSHTSPCLVGVW